MTSGACVCLSVMALTIIMATNESHPFPPWQPATPPNDSPVTCWDYISKGNNSNQNVVITKNSNAS